MKFSNRFGMFLIAAVLFAIGVTLFGAGAVAQEDGWRIIRADYGNKTQRNDVTHILSELIERGGVNGRVAVNNQTMGGDPAVGADKSLRVFARNRKHEEREFDYKEGSFVEASSFNVRGDDRDDPPANYGAAGPDEGWRITRADYGSKTKRNDVTHILTELIERGGVNGRVSVTNQTMGGDPAVGADKSLRIFARNRKYEEREFNYNEGGFVEVRLFNVRRDEWDDRPANYGDRDRERDDKGPRIVRAFYGVQGRTVNVTELLRSRVRDGALIFVVTNNALGGDPAAGYDKTLIVVYRYQGTETATAVHEGNTLTLP